MNTIPLNAVINWSSHGSLHFPAAVDCVCPLCQKHTSLVFKLTACDGATKIITGHLRCSRCTKSSLLAVFASTSPERKCDMIVVHPESPAEKASVLPTDIVINERIVRSYETAIKSFNAGIWDSTSVACRKTLEGLVKLMLPEDKRTGALAQQIKSLPAHTDLSKPILELAEALKEGGNIGAHFDHEKETTEEIARQMIKLVEYVILYLHVIPKEVEKLKSELETPGSPSAPQPITK